jgi:hypothetical protein
MGYNTTASGYIATALGYNTTATGSYSTAIGQMTNASGYNSFALGNNTASKSAYETVFGRYNTDYIPNDQSNWNANDRLFVVGNGTGSDARSNALTILKNGNTGIGTDTPTALLHTSGTGTGEGNVLFTGERKTTSPGNPPAEGAGTRLMWYSDKAALRAGYVTGTQWDKDDIGISSISMGINTKATGYNTTAFGQNTTASDTLATAIGFNTVASGFASTAMGRFTNSSGDFAIAMGRSTTASGTAALSSGILSTATGEYATAMGYNCLASGVVSVALGNETNATATYATALGYFTTASGGLSTSMGANTEAESGYETVVGRWNEDYTPNSTTGWNTDDRLFVVGNGTGSGARSNAMTILKNGRVGLQTVTSPTFALELPNSSSDGIGKGRANAWTTYSDGRIKSAIKQISYGLKEILQIKPLSYFQHNSDLSSGKLELSNDGSNSIGFIAQDIYKILPELVTKPENENTGLWSVSYDKLTPVLVKAVQEQQEIIDEQNLEIDAYKQKLMEQENRINNLENMMQEILSKDKAKK